MKMGGLHGLVAAVLLGAATVGWGQGAGSNWDRVKQVRVETAVRVRSTRAVGGRHVNRCNVVSVGDAELVCASTRTVFFVPVSRELRFARSEVREVRLTRRALSALVGGAVGVGIGVGAGFGLAGAADRAEDPGLLQFVLALLGGSLGARLGAGSDFLGGPVIYRVP